MTGSYERARWIVARSMPSTHRYYCHCYPSFLSIDRACPWHGSTLVLFHTRFGCLRLTRVRSFLLSGDPDTRYRTRIIIFAMSFRLSHLGWEGSRYKWNIDVTSFLFEPEFGKKTFHVNESRVNAQVRSRYVPLSLSTTFSQRDFLSHSSLRKIHTDVFFPAIVLNRYTLTLNRRFYLVSTFKGGPMNLTLLTVCALRRRLFNDSEGCAVDNMFQRVAKTNTFCDIL